MKSTTSFLVLAIAIMNVVSVPVDNARPAANIGNGNTHNQNAQNGNTGVIDGGNDNSNHSGNTGHFGGRPRAVESADASRPVNVGNGNTNNQNTQNHNSGVIGGGNDNSDHSGNTGHFGGRVRAVEADAFGPINIDNGNTCNENTQNDNTGIIIGGHGNTGGNTDHKHKSNGGCFSRRAHAVEAADARRPVNVDNDNTDNQDTQNHNSGVINGGNGNTDHSGNTGHFGGRARAVEATDAGRPINFDNGNTFNENTQNDNTGLIIGGNGITNHGHSSTTVHSGSAGCFGGRARAVEADAWYPINFGNCNTYNRNTQNHNTGVIDGGHGNTDFRHSGNTGFFGGRARAVGTADVELLVNADNGNTDNQDTQNLNPGAIGGKNGITGHFGGGSRARGIAGEIYVAHKARATSTEGNTESIDLD